MSRASQPASGSQRMPGTQVGKNSPVGVQQQPVDAPQQGPATRRSQTKWGELPPDGATAARFCKAFGFTLGDVPGDGWCAGAALVASYWNSLLVQATERRDMVQDWEKLELVPSVDKPQFDQIVECYLRDMMALLVERALFLESSVRDVGCSLMQEPPKGYRLFVPRESHRGVVPDCLLRSLPDGGLPMYAPAPAHNLNTRRTRAHALARPCTSLRTPLHALARPRLARMSSPRTHASSSPTPPPPPRLLLASSSPVLPLFSALTTS